MKLILFCIYGVFFSFVVSYAVFATKTFDGAIEHSYEKGMAYPEKLARLQELDWTFRTDDQNFRTGEEAPLVMWIHDRADQPVNGATVRFEVIRPAGPVSLPVKVASESEPGRYVAPIVLPDYGHWLVKVQVVYAQDHLEHEFRIYASKG